MTNRINFLAGVASSGWTALVGLVAVPWYIRFLGIEAYGMIGIYLTLQSIFVLLDMGLSPTVSREVARSMVAGTMPHARILVHTMAVLFVASGGIAATGLAGLAPWLARNWLDPGKLPIDQVVEALALSAVAIGARWPATLYTGVLNGARRVDLASGVTIGTVTLANAGAVIVLVFVETSLRAFFIWQVLVSALHSVLMWAAARHAIGRLENAKFDWPAVKSIWRFSTGMAAVTVTGVVFSQIDKVVLARTVSLSEVGYYTLATALAGILYRLVVPAFNVVYPQLSGLVEAGSPVALSRYYHSSTRLYLTLIFPCATFLIVCARPLLSLWFHDPIIVAQTSAIVILLSLGTAIHCAMYFPYALQVASGLTSVPLVINIVLLLMFLPIVILLASARGAIGVAIAWVILHVFYFIFGTYLTDRRVLPGEGWAWVVRGVTPPLAISVGFGFAAAGLMPLAKFDLYRLCLGGFTTVGAIVTGAVMLPDVRMALARITRGAIRG